MYQYPDTDVLMLIIIIIIIIIIVSIIVIISILIKVTLLCRNITGTLYSKLQSTTGTNTPTNRRLLCVQ